jgi:hypothetical protein
VLLDAGGKHRQQLGQSCRLCVTMQLLCAFFIHSFNVMHAESYETFTELIPLRGLRQGDAALCLRHASTPVIAQSGIKKHSICSKA